MYSKNEMEYRPFVYLEVVLGASNPSVVGIKGPASVRMMIKAASSILLLWSRKINSHVYRYASIKTEEKWMDGMVILLFCVYFVGPFRPAFQ